MHEKIKMHKILIRKFVILAGIGFLGGMAFGDLIAVFITFARGSDVLVLPQILMDRTGSMAGALAAQAFMSGIIGAAAIGGTILYELERPPLLVVSLSHYLLIMAAYYPAAFYMGWLEPVLHDVLPMAIAQTIAYVFIWAFMDIHYRIEVRELNRLLQETADQSNLT